MAGERKYISAKELKQHDKPEDLWISIQGKVYNATDWAKVHSGENIPLLNLVGQDVTDAFIAYHPGVAWQYLDKFFTGYYLKDFKVSEVSKDFRKLATLENLLMNFQNLGCLRRKAMKSYTPVLSLDSCTWCVFMVFCVLRVLGFIWSSCVGHDSRHYQIMSSLGFNKLAQILVGNCIIGISIAWWKWTHNAHHIACNSLDYDPNLQHILVFSVSSNLFNSIKSIFYGRILKFDSVARFLVSYQLCTFLLLFSRRNIPDRALNIMGICVFWTWYPLLVSCLPNYGERVMLVLMSMAMTSIQHIQFTLNHFLANVNLEHNLFPRLPRCHLRSISSLAKDLCKKHNLPYRGLLFWEANVTTIRALRNTALQARDLTNLVPKNLVWETAMIHG
ncbi:hypothetical protein PVL29_011977 [Vitis rotundifolia]|uniref:Cytochrome b5 heme-binding domain-containing protein n=1 Tax=Vitis rotundifolia TaxID=103349 RepID=A0AA38ZQF8_VITRO|nr:hypothetical protein PVL29_011977 [Vitis rotundifolia]